MAMKTYQGGCHCGAVRFEADLDLGAGTHKCNCSICTKQRFWGALVKPASFRMVAGADALSDYLFASKSNHHLFCKHCGVRSFVRANIAALGGEIYAINVACLDADPRELAAAPVRFYDGRHDNWETPPAETGHL
jgi:hypothetical protein